MTLRSNQRYRADTRRFPRRYFSERLEPRLLLATFSGTIWNDADGDGRRDPFDTGLGGWTVYLDVNANGSRDALEPSDVTDGSGAYSFTATGRTGAFVHVREVSQSGWRPTVPDDGEHLIAFPALSATGVDFGNTQYARVAGAVFNDADDDGVRGAPEVGLGSWTIFSDADNDAVLDAAELRTTTAADGTYSLALPAGTHTLRQVNQSGWWPTHPAAGAHTLTLAAAQQAGARNFGNVAATYDLTGAGFFVTSTSLPVPADGRIDIEYAVRNDGTADSPAFGVGFYLSEDATISTADTLLRTEPWGAVPRHGSLSRRTTIVLPSPDPFRTDNEYFVGIVVDPAGAVAETNESNNRNVGVGLDRFPLSSEADLPRPVDNATVRPREISLTAANPELSVSSAIGDEWVGAYDQDVYRVAVKAGHPYRAFRTAGDVSVRHYDSNWAPLTEFYTPAADGAYYVVGAPPAMTRATRAG